MLKNKSGKIMIWITIIVIAIAIIGAVVWFQNKENNNSKVNDVSINKANVESKNESKWNITYSNEEYNTYNEEKLVSKNMRNVPNIKNKENEEAAEKIQESLTNISNEHWEYIKETSDDYKKVESEETLGVTYLISTEYENENYITFKFSESGGFGGVSWADTKLYTYDTQYGELLSLKNIATDYDELIGKLYDISVKNLEGRQLGLIDGWKDDLKELIVESGNYGLIEGKIEIVLPKYSIAAGADGVIVIDIDKEEIKNFIKEQYR